MTRQLLEILGPCVPAFAMGGSQSSGRPWGPYSEGTGLSPHIQRPRSGAELTILAVRHISGVPGIAGSVAEVDVAEDLVGGYWRGAELRLVWHQFGDAFTVVRPGHARVTENSVGSLGPVAKLTVTWLSDWFPQVNSVSLQQAAGNWCKIANTSLGTGSRVKFSGLAGGAPTVEGKTYLFARLNALEGLIIEDDGVGTPLVLTATGVADMDIVELANIAGYVHLGEKWKTYESVRVLTPFQPIEPGEYPAFDGVPGKDFSSLSSYEDVGLFLEGTLLEGIEGHGSIGAATVSGLTLSVVGGAVLDDAVFADGYVHYGHAKARVATNTAGAITVKAWEPSAPSVVSATVTITPPNTCAAVGHEFRVNERVTIWETAIGGLQVAFNGTANTVEATGHELTDGRVVLFAGALPPEITAGQRFFVVNATANDFQLALIAGGTPIGFQDEPAGPTVGTLPEGIAHGEHLYVVNPSTDAFQLSREAGGAPIMFPDAGRGTITVSTGAFHVYLPHHQNNPHHFDAGEGFLYPNNDHMPGGFTVLSTGTIYSRPRGRVEVAPKVIGTADAPGGCYVGRSIADGRVSAAIRQSNEAASIGGATTQFVVARTDPNPFFTIQCGHTINDAVGGVIQFDRFLRPGYIVRLAGFQDVGTPTTSSILGSWRVVDVLPLVTVAGTPAGSTITLEQWEGGPQLPEGTFSVQATAGATVYRTNIIQEYRLGWHFDFGIRMAQAIGKAVNFVLLAINSASQVLANTNNAFCFQGRIGWFDDDHALDWTPSNPRGNAARYKRLIEIIAPAALQAVANPLPLRYLGIGPIFQGEADALSDTGQDFYYESIEAFDDWVRDLLEPWSPYTKPAKIPALRAKITTDPWSSLSDPYGLGIVAGDIDGKINAAFDKWRDMSGGFNRTIDPDLSLKLGFSAPGIDPGNIANSPFGSFAAVFAGWPGVDTIHFGAAGEVRNAELAANEAQDMLEFAHGFLRGPSAVELCNQALNLIGEEATIGSLTPPDDTVEARLCASVYRMALEIVLQRHSWTFASRRTSPPKVELPIASWSFAYVVPADCLHPTAVLDPEGTDDLQIRTILSQESRGIVTLLGNASQPFTVEHVDGVRILRTDQDNALLVYASSTVDPRDWDPLARQAMVWRLVHFIAGPLIKGDAGRQQSEAALQLSEALLGQAAATNQEFQRDVTLDQRASWMP